MPTASAPSSTFDSDRVEASRLELLRRLAILDTPAEPAFDALVQTASIVCRCPISLMSLIDTDRQWFKAAFGLDAAETPRDQAFCAHAIQTDDLFLVPDAQHDERFVANPLVTGDPRIRFYAGQPIVFDGVALGTLCVIDRVPRDLDADQRAMLRYLSIAMGGLLHGRLEAQLHHREAERLQSFARLSGDWLWEIDAEHRCTWFSGDVARAGPLFAGALPGARFCDFDVLDRMGSPIPDTTLIDLFDRGTAFADVLVEVDADDGQRFVFLSAEPVSTVGGYRGSARDATVQVRAERDLLEREAFVRKIAGHVPGVIYQFRRFPDRRACFPYVSEGMRDVLEIAPESVRHDATVFLDRIHRSDVPAFQAAVTESRNGATVLDTRFRVVLPQKGVRWLQLKSMPESLADGSTLWHGFMSDVTESHARDRELGEAHDALQSAQRRLVAITDNLPALVAYLDDDLRYTFVNEHHRRVFGKTANSFIGKSMADVHGDLYADLEPHARLALRGQRVSFEGSEPGPTGVEHFQCSFVPDRDADGRVLGFYAMTFNLTARREAELKLIRGEQRLRQLTDNLPVMISTIDLQERMTYANETLRAWIGTDLDRIVGRTVLEAIGPTLYEQRVVHLRRCFAGEQVSFEMESPSEGGTRCLQTTYLPDVGADGRTVGITTLTVDVTDRKVAERRLSRLAHSDTLTGLPNRLRFDDEVARILDAHCATDFAPAIMFLDVDRFKTINDTHGHAVGDAVLKEFAVRLRNAVRRTDFVARLAGDEFVIVLERVPSGEVAGIARKIVDEVGRPFRIEQLQLIITTSIGIAFRDEEATTAAAILAKADAALYRAKEAGRNTFRLAA